MKGRKSWATLISLVFVIFLLTFLLAASVDAATFRSNGTIVIGPNDVLDDDLYAAGQAVLIEGRVTGDVYAFAQQVVVSGQVDGDLVAMGQVVSVSGRVNDDVRAMGQVVRIAGQGVGDDVLAMGASVEVAENTPVGGDLIVGAYQVLVAGQVEGDVLAGTNNLEISGVVGGNVNASVGESRRTMPPAVFLRQTGVPVPVVPPGLTVTDGAVIYGDLQYRAVNDAHIAPGAQVKGEIKHLFPSQPQRPKEKKAFGTLPWVLDQVRRLIALLGVAILLFLVYPQGMRALGGRIHDRPLAAFGWGIIAFFGLIAVLLIVLFATIIGGILFGVLTLGMLARWTFVLGFLFDVVLIVGYFFYVTFVVPAAVPYAPFARLDRGKLWWLPFVIVGVVLYVVLTALPYAGSILNVLFILVGLGALLLRWRPNGRPAPAVATTAPPPEPEVPPTETQLPSETPDESA